MSVLGLGEVVVDLLGLGQSCGGELDQVVGESNVVVLQEHVPDDQPAVDVAIESEIQVGLDHLRLTEVVNLEQSGEDSDQIDQEGLKGCTLHVRAFLSVARKSPSA